MPLVSPWVMAMRSFLFSVSVGGRVEMEWEREAMKAGADQARSSSMRLVVSMPQAA